VLVLLEKLSGAVINTLAFGPRGLGVGVLSHATILLGSNFGQVVYVYSHCLTGLLSSKKLRYKREYLDWSNLTAKLIECVRLS